MAAASLGGHARVGFENNLFLKSGEPAASNAALVAQVCQGPQRWAVRWPQPTIFEACS